MKFPPTHILIAFFCAVMCCFGESPLLAQMAEAEPSKAVKDAAKLAEKLEYAEAVRMLELALVEGDTSEVLIMDLAGYYKKVGNLRMATALCKPLVDKDRPRPWHLLEVSTMLIDQGRFTDAEPYLQRFEELKPLDNRASYLRKRIGSRLDITDMYPAARLDTFLHNTLADDGFPFVWESEIYWSSDRDGSKRTSGWTGRAMVGLYTCQREAEHGYTPWRRLESRFNKGTINTASPCLSVDGQTLYYTANAEEFNKQGELNMQLYQASRDGDGWHHEQRLVGQPSGANCVHPSITPDGKYLYYAADAADSRGGLDLYRMSPQADGSWGSPDNLGSTINSERNDGFPVAATDGKLYFASQGHIGLGGFDIFVSEELPNGDWTTPRNLGEPINSDADETKWLPYQSRQAYLVSNRQGGDDDIYEVRW